MIIKLNLAPEVYQTSQRNKRRKQVATTLGVIISSVSVGLIVLGFVIVGGQKIAISAYDSGIKKDQDKVKTYSELTDAVTAQKHLVSLKALHDGKLYFSHFFEVLEGVAPQGIVAGDATVANDNTLAISAQGKNYDLSTKFAKALEAYNVTIGPTEGASKTEGEEAAKNPYFTNVSLGSVSSQTGNTVGFKITTQMSAEVIPGEAGNGQD